MDMRYEVCRSDFINGELHSNDLKRGDAVQKSSSNIM